MSAATSAAASRSPTTSGGRYRQTAGARRTPRRARARATVATDGADTRTQHNLREDSDSLLDAVREIRDLERTKRTQKLSSPEFHQTAEEITDKSRRVFHIARDEEAEGDALDGPSDKTTEDIGG